MSENMDSRELKSLLVQLMESKMGKLTETTRLRLSIQSLDMLSRLWTEKSFSVLQVCERAQIIWKICWVSLSILQAPNSYLHTTPYLIAVMRYVKTSRSDCHFSWRGQGRRRTHDDGETDKYQVQFGLLRVAQILCDSYRKDHSVRSQSVRTYPEKTTSRTRDDATVFCTDEDDWSWSGGWKEDYSRVTDSSNDIWEWRTHFLIIWEQCSGRVIVWDRDLINRNEWDDQEIRDQSVLECSVINPTTQTMILLDRRTRAMEVDRVSFGEFLEGRRNVKYRERPFQVVNDGDQSYDTRTIPKKDAS